ncbi:unnamed protein product [Dracunculus medinensis]|uniref:Esterase n=1 Tax=Dracunculus medinensis TaxID=318479 RepID=A0A0N4U643_DRAME|nr:unnamed protein product [Dracunculus medinensis]
MIFILVVNFIIASITAQSHVFLPDAPPNNFEIFSGYFTVNVNNINDEKIHYMLIKAETNPESKPLIVWTVNEVGCSNYWSLFASFGPFRIHKNGSAVTINPDSWTKAANLLVFDVPGGSGYSLGQNETDYMDEDLINIYEAVLIKFRQTFPEYTANDMYLAGSDSSGWINLLFVEQLIEKNLLSAWNVKGVIGLSIHVNWSIDYSTLLTYVYNRGYIDESDYRYILNECCGGDIDNCSLFAMTTDCAAFSLNATSNLISSGLNPFDINKPCQINQIERFYEVHKKNSIYNLGNVRNLRTDKPECYNFNEYTTYFNRNDVKAALNVLPESTNWVVCKLICNDDEFIKFRELNYIQNFLYDLESMAKKAKNSNVTMLLLNGDSQLRSPIPPQRLGNDLGNSMFSKKKPFYVDGLIRGFITQYDRISVATIMGGDYLCSNKGDAMLLLLKSFLNNQPL